MWDIQRKVIEMGVVLYRRDKEKTGSQREREREAIEARKIV